MKGLRAILLCLLGCLGGCSGSDEDAGPYATVSSFCTEWGKAACSAAAVTACSGTDSATQALTDACIDSQKAFCKTLVPSASYSPMRAEQCVTAVRNAYSDGRLTALEIATVRHRGNPCNHLIKGAQDKGDSCTRDDDCDTVNDYLCVSKSGEGSCQIPALVDNGTSCAAPEATCNPDFYCGVDESCVQTKAVGKACTATFQCATGLDCETGTCVARVSQQDCTEDADCTTNVCAIPVGADTGRCVSSIILAPSEGVCEALRSPLG